MEIIRVVKKNTLPVLLINIFIIGMCVFGLQTQVQDSDRLYAKLIDAYNKDSDIELEEYLLDNSCIDEEASTELIKKFNSQVEYISSYKNNKIEAVKNAEKMAGYSLFTDRNSYSYLKLQKSSNVALKTAYAEVSLSNTLAIENFMKFRWLPLLFMLTGLVIISSYKEEEVNKVNVLIRTSSNGRTGIITKRVIITFLLTFIDSIVINLIIFGLFLKTYGGREYIGNVIQSSQIYADFPLVISINDFFMLYCIMFALAMYAIFLLMYIFVQYSRTLKLAYVKILILGVIEYLFYNNISPKSMWNFLKYANIFSVVMIQDSLKNISWGRNGFITDTIATTVCIVILLIVMSIIFNFIIYIKKYPVRKKRMLDLLADKTEVMFQRLISRFKIFGGELYKFLFAQNGLLILIVFFVAISSCRIYRGVNYENQNMYYNDFFKEYEGMAVDESVYEYLINLEQEIKILKEKEKLLKNEKKQISQMQEALVALNSQVKYLEEIKENRNIDAIILDEKEYNEIFGERMNRVCENINAICVLIIILSFANIYNYEKKTGVIKLLRISKERKKYVFNKFKLVILITAIISTSSGLFNISNVFSVYDSQYLSAPIHCISAFKNFPIDVTICEYIIICQLIRALIMFVVGMVVACISYYAGYLKSLIIGLLIMLPYLLYLFNVPFMNYLSLPIWLDINRCIRFIL